MAAEAGPAIAECVHCHTPITDVTTRVTNGSLTYCCSNCSAAMEQTGPGSDPDSATGKNHLRCSHCGVPIVNEANMQGSESGKGGGGGYQIFCCPNCAAHARQDQEHNAARR
jgi:DNA-directed RNA polymerase subunit RPC12/RpoP